MYMRTVFTGVNFKMNMFKYLLIIVSLLSAANAWAISPVLDQVCLAPGHVDMKNEGRLDAWVLKLDKNLELLWEKIIGGTKNDYMFDAINVPGGGCIFVGSRENKRGPNRDFWIVKTDKQGSIEWNKTYGDDGDNILYAVKMIKKDFVVAGVTFPKGEKTPKAWLARLDADGDVIWSKYVSSNQATYAYDIVVSDKQELLVAGVTDAKKKHWWDAWVVKLDLDGDVIWEKIYGGMKTDSAYGIVETKDHHYYVAGSTDSKGDGMLDGWVFKIDEEGDLLDEWVFGGGKDDVVLSIATTTADTFWAAGYTESEGKGKMDGWVILYDEKSGDVTTATHGGNYDDFIFDIIPTDNNQVLTMGGASKKGVKTFKAWFQKIDQTNELVSEQILD